MDTHGSDSPHAAITDVERDQLAERLEQYLISTGSLTQEQADYDRMIRMAGSVLVTRGTDRAVKYAIRTRDPRGIRIALRELQKLMDEEDLAIALAVA